TGCGNGAACGRARNRRPRPRPPRETCARVASGVPDRFERGVAGRCEKIALLPHQLAYGFAEVAAATGTVACGTLETGLKSVHLITRRTGISSPFKFSVPSERE